MSQASFTILWGLTMKYSTEAHSCIYASSHQGAEAENTEHSRQTYWSSSICNKYSVLKYKMF